MFIIKNKHYLLFYYVQISKIFVFIDKYQIIYYNHGGRFSKLYEALKTIQIINTHQIYCKTKVECGND